MAIFGYRLGESGSRWVRNTNTLEYANHGGSFYNTTLEGQITGKGLDLGVVDDPIKGRAEANSKTVRDKVWHWFTDDFLTRFSDSAGLLMIMTRWHLDDPVGRFIERFPDAEILRYPAIAEEDEKNRRKGEPLFPEHKSLLFLLERKTSNDAGQLGERVSAEPDCCRRRNVSDREAALGTFFDSGRSSSVRYFDKAGTDGGGA